MLVVVVAATATVIAGGLSGHTPAAAEASSDTEAASGSWVDGGLFEEPPRANHGAALLTGEGCEAAAAPWWCGEVLVAGGQRRSAAPEDYSSAELYDPGTPKGEWRSTGSMQHNEGDVDLVGLSDGRALVLGPGGARPELYEPGAEPSTGEWSPTAPRATSVRGASAITRLSDGRVFVLTQRAGEIYDLQGGVESGGTAEGVEVGKGLWTPTAPHPATTRDDGASATLLTAPACHGSDAPEWCGKVLVVGGNSGSIPSKQTSNPEGLTELYDPAQDDWEDGGELAAGLRDGHSTTVLDGEVCDASEGPEPAWCAEDPAAVVLVTGGRARGDSVNETELRDTAEVYNPETRQWHMVMPEGENQPSRMATARTQHFATPLNNGTVLLSGGLALDEDGREAALRSAEVFDPRTGEFTETASSEQAPGSAGSAVGLLDGRVLVSLVFGAEMYVQGESVQPTPEVGRITPDTGLAEGGQEVVISGDHLSPVRGVTVGSQDKPATIEAEGSQRLRVTMPAHDPGTVAVTVTTAGGSATGHFTYLPAGGLWSLTEALSQPRQEVAAATLAGSACEDGSASEWCGDALVVSDGTAEAYVPETGSWREVSEPPQEATSATATGLGDGRVLVVGQFAAHVYDPSTDSWQHAVPVRPAGVGHTATLLDDGRVLVAGGGNEAQTAQLYDPSTGLWSLAASMNRARRDHAAVRLDDGNVLVVAGRGPTAASRHNHAEVYDPQSDTWEEVEPAGGQRTEHTATRLADGSVLVVGGQRPVSGGKTPTAQVERFYPDGDGPCPGGTWCAEEPLPLPRTAHQTALLPDGRVMVAGGRGPGSEADKNARAEVGIYDPATRAWQPTARLTVPRYNHSLTMLDQGECGGRCGSLLVAGGSGRESPFALESAEVYTPRPRVTGVDPARGPLAGGVDVALSGVGLGGDVSVSFGGATADVASTSPGRLTAVAPPAPGGESGPVEVSATVVPADGDASDALSSLVTAEFTYVGDPARVTDLAGEATSASEVRLTWSAVDDGSGQPAERYELVRADTPITSKADFEAAEALCGGVCAGFRVNDLGEALTQDVAGLPADSTFHYAVRAVNDVAGAGPVSDSVAVTTPPAPTAPAALGDVADLSAEAVSPSEVELSWTAVDDGAGAPSDEYVVVQSRQPVDTEGGFADAQVLCEPACAFDPGAVGDEVVLEVAGLASETTYHYALKPVDHAGELGALSNPASATTPVDPRVPGRVTDLTAEAVSASEVELTWSAPGARGSDPPPAGAFIVKQSREPIATEDDFAAAKTLCEPACGFEPGQVGQALALSVTDLAADTTYHYALKAVDGELTGPRSNAAQATTLAGDTAAAAARACPGELAPAAFADRASIPEVHLPSVDCVAQQGISRGFDDDTFRPRLPVLRDAMASFVVRTLEAADVALPPAEQGQGFADVAADSVHREAIERLAAAGIVVGGSGELSAQDYGPRRTVRRDQMASFLIRAAEYADSGQVSGQLASPEQAFADVPAGNVHYENVNGAAAQGLAHGVDDTHFAPAGLTTRDQMATFLVRLLASTHEPAR